MNQINYTPLEQNIGTPNAEPQVQIPKLDPVKGDDDHRSTIILFMVFLLLLGVTIAFTYVFFIKKEEPVLVNQRPAAVAAPTSAPAVTEPTVSEDDSLATLEEEVQGTTVQDFTGDLGEVEKDINSL